MHSACRRRIEHLHSRDLTRQLPHAPEVLGPLAAALYSFSRRSPISRAACSAFEFVDLHPLEVISLTPNISPYVTGLAAAERWMLMRAACLRFSRRYLEGPYRSSVSTASGPALVVDTDDDAETIRPCQSFMRARTPENSSEYRGSGRGLCSWPSPSAPRRRWPLDVPVERPADGGAVAWCLRRSRRSLAAAFELRGRGCAARRRGRRPHAP